MDVNPQRAPHPLCPELVSRGCSFSWKTLCSCWVQSPKGLSPTDTGAVSLSLRPAAGFMTQDERKKFESLHSDFNKYWIPCVWFTNLAAQARRDGRIHDDVALRLLMDVSQRRVRRGGTRHRWGGLCKARVTRPCPLCPGAESLPGQVQHVVPLRLDKHPSGVHAGGYPVPCGTMGPPSSDPSSFQPTMAGEPHSLLPAPI